MPLPTPAKLTSADAHNVYAGLVDLPAHRATV